MPEPARRLGSKDLGRVLDLSPLEVLPLLEQARLLKSDYTPWRDTFRQRSIVLLFEKPSLRTRVSFEIGFAKFGGTAVYLDHQGSPIGAGEIAGHHRRERVDERVAGGRLPVAGLPGRIEHGAEGVGPEGARRDGDPAEQ